MNKEEAIVDLQTKIIGYNNKKYTIAELRQLCPSHSEIKQHIAVEKRTHEFRKRYELIYNSQVEMLEDEIWIRLSQKRFENFFVSNKARVRWISKRKFNFRIRSTERSSNNPTPGIVSGKTSIGSTRYKSAPTITSFKRSGTSGDFACSQRKRTLSQIFAMTLFSLQEVWNLIPGHPFLWIVSRVHLLF